ncbi:MAG TPA: hypothetical protein EYQ31_06260 [Candidatus Handelsmanbacteria bacterium]|nr:hypothetical protein [Candidatus Handelsmanbacteria bacterium]
MASAGLSVGFTATTTAGAALASIVCAQRHKSDPRASTLAVIGLLAVVVAHAGYVANPPEPWAAGVLIATSVCGAGATLASTPLLFAWAWVAPIIMIASGDFDREWWILGLVAAGIATGSSFAMVIRPQVQPNVRASKAAPTVTKPNAQYASPFF